MRTMWQCLQFDTIKGVGVDEKLLKRRKVSYGNLILEQLKSLLEVSNGDV